MPNRQRDTDDEGRAEIRKGPKGLELPAEDAELLSRAAMFVLALDAVRLEESGEDTTSIQPGARGALEAMAGNPRECTLLSGHRVEAGIDALDKVISKRAGVEGNEPVPGRRPSSINARAAADLRRRLSRAAADDTEPAPA